MPIMAGAEPWRHDGSNVAVLLCHGFTGSPGSLRSVGQALADEGFTVRLPRLPGHGTSWQELNETRWPQWYGELEAELSDLAERAAGGGVVVFGLSMGGALALRLAQQRPELVAGVVLVNPAVFSDDRRMRFLPLLQHLLPSVAGVGNDVKRPDGPSEVAYDRVPLRALASQRKLWGLVVTDLAAVTQPVLVFRSAEDHVVPAESTRRILAGLGSQDVTEIVLEDSYHVATIDNDAPLITRTTIDFIRRVTGSTGHQGHLDKTGALGGTGHQGEDEAR